MVVTSLMLTQPSTVPEPPEGGLSDASTHDVGQLPSKAVRRAAVVAYVLGAVVLGAVIAASVAPSRWFIDKERCSERNEAGDCISTVTEPAEFALVPANAAPVDPLLDISGTEVYDDEGGFLFVTVREPRLSMLDWLAARNDPAARLRSYVEKYGDRSPEDVRQQGQRQMSGAKEWAIYVALSRAGLDAEFVPGPAVVDYVLCLEANADGSDCVKFPPSGDVLQPNDVIVEADGVEVRTLADLSPIIAERSPGDTITLVIQRGDETVSGEVELIAAPDEPERTIIGFMPVDTTTLRMPDGVTVDFDTGGIGGPSAGLAFTLALLDAVTDGDLTGGVEIAVTGSIDPDGNVGAIGGLSAKAEAVRQMGVRYFLVPASQPPDGFDSIAAAQAAVGDEVELIPVATLDEALQVLGELGGDPLTDAAG